VALKEAMIAVFEEDSLGCSSLLLCF
jgi:hypothetical protein